jgi:hypothetical protein
MATRKQSGPSSSGLADLANNAQELASRTATTGMEAARRMAEQQVSKQTSAAADQVEHVAEMLDTAADTVERVVPPAADYVRQAASSVHDASETLREQTIDDVVEAVMRFARAQPAAFAGASVLVGFALARFLKSSADRRTEAGQGMSRVRNSGRPRPGSRQRASTAGGPPGADVHGPASTSDQHRSR